MSEIDLGKYMEESIVRRYRIEGTVENILGEHASREQTISSSVFAQKDQHTEEEKEKVEKRSRKREKSEVVHTFPKDADGNLLIPLGGKHGYIYGALRTALLDLYKDKLQDRNWKGYGLGTYISQGVFINPEWVPVGKKFGNPEESPKGFMVQTAGISKGVITIYYDYVDKADFTLMVDMTNEKIPEDIFLRMLAHTQRLGIGPKGRGTLKYTKATRTK